MPIAPIPLVLDAMHTRRRWLARLPRLFALGGMGGLGGLLAGPAGAAPAARAAPALRSPGPPLRLRLRRLANGLQVASLADPTTPTVSVQVWYRVGGKDDPPGRSGFAHLFEHMMFKRTRRMPDEMFDRLTEDVGGQNNAFTAEDVTAYQNEVPSNHLERLLWAEAERMAHLQVDQANFDSERKVVIEELRERVLADPYGRLFHALPSAAFRVHPYRRPVIGSEADLMAATLADVQRFHATYYRPDNALLIVAGDADPGQLDAWVDRHFGPLKSPDTPVPRVPYAEPPLPRAERRELFGPQVPLPAVAMVWRGPAAGHPDAAPLQVAQALLGAGDSARLNEHLVYRDEVAQAAGFAADLYADAGSLVAYAIAASGHAPDALAAHLDRELRRLAEQPIAPSELDKVRNQLLTAQIAGRQTPQGRADAIGRAALLLGDAREADRQLQRLRAVTAADVQRAIRRHVLQAPAVTLVYRQQAA